jgi:uncharacterized membrane protein
MQLTKTTRGMLVGIALVVIFVLFEMAWAFWQRQHSYFAIIGILVAFVLLESVRVIWNVTFRDAWQEWLTTRRRAKAGEEYKATLPPKA